jgi:hypothetical protein
MLANPARPARPGRPADGRALARGTVSSVDPGRLRFPMTGKGGKVAVGWGGEFAVAIDASGLAEVGDAIAAELAAAGTGVGIAAATVLGAAEAVATTLAAVATQLHTAEALATPAIADATPQALMTQSCAAD